MAKTQVRISQFEMIPFDSKQLSTLSLEERGRAQHGQINRVAGEKVLEKFYSEDIPSNRNEVQIACRDFGPQPINVVLDGSLPDFIAEKKYYANDRNAIYEVILFGPSSNYTILQHSRTVFDERMSESRDGKTIEILQKPLLTDTEKYRGNQTQQISDAKNCLLPSSMIEVCRILGKKMDDVSNSIQYYAGWHKLAEPIYATNNLLYASVGKWS